MNRIVIAVALILSSPIAPLAINAAYAQSAQTAQHSTMTEGEVRRVDKEAKKLTIRHGPIKNLGMPPMTMVFQVKDAAMLDKVNPGDRINFFAEKTDGAYTVTEIEPVQ